MSDRYGSFTFRVTCRHCGQPGPVNLPTRTHACAYCQQLMELPPELFGDLLGLFDDEHRELARGGTEHYEDEAEGLVVHGSYQRVDKPLCEKCKEPFRDESIVDGSARDIFCASCGDPASTAPVPPWLGALVPSARQIVSVQRGAAGGVGQQPEVAAETAEPIAMACPSCGAGLTITTEHARTTPCTFCKVSVYLPDPLWLKLHPVRTVQAWFVGFEGPSARDRERSRAEAEHASDERRRSDEDTDEAYENARGVLQAWAVLGAIALATLVAALVGLFVFPPRSFLVAACVGLPVEATVALAAGTHAFAVLRARHGHGAQAFASRITTAALLGLLPLPIGAFLDRRIHHDLTKLPRTKPRDLAPLGFFFVLQAILVPLHVALIVPTYLTLGSCPSGQSFDHTGHCFTCGSSGHPPCFGAKGRRYCDAPHVLVGTTCR